MTIPTHPAKPLIGILAGMGPRSTAPFVDLLVSECPRQYGAHEDVDYPRVAVIATRLTMEEGLYQEALGARGIELIEPPGWQDMVDELIDRIRLHVQDREIQALWSRLLAAMEASGVGAFVEACTDLNAVPRSSGKLQMFDSAQCLAAATIREWHRLSSPTGAASAVSS